MGERGEGRRAREDEEVRKEELTCTVSVFPVEEGPIQAPPRFIWSAFVKVLQENKHNKKRGERKGHSWEERRGREEGERGENENENKSARQGETVPIATLSERSNNQPREISKVLITIRERSSDDTHNTVVFFPIISVQEGGGGKKKDYIIF